MPSHPIFIGTPENYKKSVGTGSCSCGVLNCLVPPCPQAACSCVGPATVPPYTTNPVGPDGRPIVGPDPLGPPIRIDDGGLIWTGESDAGRPTEAGLFGDTPLVSPEAGEKLLLFQQVLLGLFLVGLFRNTLEFGRESKKADA